VADPLGGQQRLKAGPVQVVTADAVVQVLDPVDHDRAGDMALIVEQDVLIGFDDADAGIVGVIGHPVRVDQEIRTGVSGAHDIPPQLGKQFPGDAGEVDA